MGMPRLERIRVYPVKGLDGVDLDAVDVGDGGTLRYDRAFALFDADGSVINGKRTDRVHDIRSGYDPETGTLTVEADGERASFALDEERAAAERWLADFFGLDAELRRAGATGYVDRPEMGPSVISTATIREVASWFDALTVDGVRRRLRANLEVSDVPAFWEDRFVGDGAPDFAVGSARLAGVTPCGRCVVPERDPDTGAPTPEFRERFVKHRRATFPEWADTDAFDHYYAVMILASVDKADLGATLRVGDDVSAVD